MSKRDFQITGRVLKSIIMLYKSNKWKMTLILVILTTLLRLIFQRHEKVQTETKQQLKKRLYAEKKAEALLRKNRRKRRILIEKAETKYERLAEMRRRAAETREKERSVIKTKAGLFDKYLQSELTYEDVIKSGFQIKKKEPKKVRRWK